MYMNKALTSFKILGVHCAVGVLNKQIFIHKNIIRAQYVFFLFNVSEH